MAPLYHRYHILNKQEVKMSELSCDTPLIILERSRTALWRLIDATAKSSSSLNTYPIPDFFGPAAMQRDTFSRVRKILGIRILPRAPTLQTYLFWPIGVNQRRELAQCSSVRAQIPDIFLKAAMQRHTCSRARKKI